MAQLIEQRRPTTSSNTIVRPTHRLNGPPVDPLVSLDRAKLAEGKKGEAIKITNLLCQPSQVNSEIKIHRRRSIAFRMRNVVVGGAYECFLTAVCL